MKKLVLVFAAFALVLAACSTASGSEVASLDDTSVVADDAADDTDPAAENEKAILEFAQCMRDNGVEEFEDPDISPDGEIEFRFGGRAQSGDIDVDRETLRAAFEACQETIEGLAFGPGAIDRSEIEDTLYEFAVCMRENGVEMEDPDFSNLIPGQGNGGGPFGDSFDPTDPEVQAAIEVCQEIFGGGFRFGGPGGRGQGDEGNG
jgi:hypothetical protein